MIIRKMDDIERLKELAQQLVYLYELKYNLIKPLVDYIINNQITDTNYVEHVLDDFLDIPTDKGYDLLKRLCNYWQQINLESARFYLEEYEKLYIKKKDF